MLCTGLLYLGFPSPTLAATLRISDPPPPTPHSPAPAGSSTGTAGKAPAAAGGRGGGGARKQRAIADGQPQRWRRRLSACESAAAGLAVLQLLLPMRSYLYGLPAETLWTQVCQCLCVCVCVHSKGTTGVPLCSAGATHLSAQHLTCTTCVCAVSLRSGWESLLVADDDTLGAFHAVHFHDCSPGWFSKHGAGAAAAGAARAG